LVASVLRFAAVGASNSVIGIIVIYLAWRALGWPDLAANALGYGVGFVWGFGLNRSWTFRDRGSLTGSFLRYLLVCVVAFAINLLAVIGTRKVLGEGTFAPHLIGVCIYTVIAFLGSRFYAFRGQ
jgi:putative flippase GtrA